MNQEQKNGVRILAQRCIAEHKKSGRKMSNDEIKRLMAPYRQQAALLECSDLMFSYMMGVVSGQVRDR